MKELKKIRETEEKQSLLVEEEEQKKIELIEKEKQNVSIEFGDKFRQRTNFGESRGRDGRGRGGREWGEGGGG